MIITIITLIILLLIGWSTIKCNLNKYIKDNNSVIEYRDKFIEFCNQFNSNNNQSTSLDLYNWLIMNSQHIQNIISGFGKMDYKPAFAQYYIRNYEVILNTIPKFRNHDIEDFDIYSTDECLLRYIGYQNERISCIKKQIINPIIWFREGVKSIINIIPFLFNWFGIISSSRVRSIINSNFWNVISGIIALAGFISSLVTIIAGKEDILKLFNYISTL